MARVFVPISRFWCVLVYLGLAGVFWLFGANSVLCGDVVCGWRWLRVLCCVLVEVAI